MKEQFKNLCELLEITEAEAKENNLNIEQLKDILNVLVLTN